MMESTMVTGNTFAMATFNRDLGKKCFGFTKMDSGEFRRIKKEAFSAP